MLSLEFLSLIPHLLFLHVSKKVKNHVSGQLDILTGITLFYNGEERDFHELTRWVFLFFKLQVQIKVYWRYQFMLVTQSCTTLCEPMDCNTPGLPVYYQLPEFTQTHVHWVGDAIQPSHALSSPSSPSFNLSWHQSFPLSQFFTLGERSFGVSASTSVLPMNIQDWFL